MEGFPLLQSLIPFVLVNVPFLLIFFDAGNLNSMIYSTSYIQLGLNPWAHGANVIAGYLLEPYYYFALIEYQRTNFNPLQVAFAIKLFAIPATYFSGVLLYRIARRLRPGSERILLYSLLFNPVLLFVNDVWVESDVFVILAILLGLDLLWARPETRERTRRTVYGTAAIIWAVIGYYSAALLLPSFLLYAKERGSRIRLALGFAVWGLIFAIPIVVLGLVSSAPAHFVAGAGTSAISILNSFLPASLGKWAVVPAGLQIGALVVVGVLSVGVPLLFVRWRLPLPLGQLVVFAAATALAFSFVQGDNVVLFLPFLYLSLVTIPGLRVSYLNILLVQLFFVPELLVVMMTDGPGYVSGFYYWGYYLWHQNVFLGDTFGSGAWKACILLYYVGMIVTVAVLIRYAWRGRSASDGSVSEPESSKKESAIPPRTSWRSVALALALALLILVPVAAGMNAVSVGRLEVTNGFPAYYFGVADPAEIHQSFLLPAPDTYVLPSNNGTVQFPGNGSEVLFQRNLSTTVSSVKFAASLPHLGELAAGKEITFLEGRGLYASIANLETLSGNDVSVLPNVTSNASSVSLNTTILTGSTPAYSFGTHGAIWYSTPSVAVANTTWFWGEFMPTNGSVPSLLWSMVTGNWTILMEESNHRFAVHGTSVDGVTFDVSTAADYSSASWVLTGFSLSASGLTLTVFLNGGTIVIPENAGSDLQLQVGYSSAAEGGPLATASVVTGAYDSPTGLQFEDAVLVARSNQSSPVAYLHGRMANVTFQTTAGSTTTVLGAGPLAPPTTFVASGPPYIGFGRIGDTLPALNLTFQLIQFQGRGGWDSLGVVVIGFGAGIPGALVIAYYIPREWGLPWRRARR